METNNRLRTNPRVNHPQRLWPDSIPGTSKIRTHFANHFIYSEESDLDQWLKKHEDVNSGKK